MGILHFCWAIGFYPSSHQNGQALQFVVSHLCFYLGDRIQLGGGLHLGDILTASWGLKGISSTKDATSGHDNSMAALLFFLFFKPIKLTQTNHATSPARAVCSVTFLVYTGGILKTSVLWRTVVGPALRPCGHGTQSGEGRLDRSSYRMNILLMHGRVWIEMSDNSVSLWANNRRKQGSKHDSRSWGTGGTYIDEPGPFDHH